MLDLKIFKIRMNDTPQGDGNCLHQNLYQFYL